MFTLHLALALLAIAVGGRLGGIALGAVPALALIVFTFGFHIAPSPPPVGVLLIIGSVVTAASALEAAGGLDLLVRTAERILRKKPNWITFLGPAVVYVFTLFSGTGHIAYALLPVIAEVARAAGIRPERPLTAAVIASEQGITASPVSAATATFLTLLAARDPSVTLLDILIIAIPSTFMAVMLAALAVCWRGANTRPDPTALAASKIVLGAPAAHHRGARRSVSIFVGAALAIVVLGVFRDLRPLVLAPSGKLDRLSMEVTIELVMLGAAALIALVARVPSPEITQGNVFRAGMTAMMCVFGVAWLGATFFGAHRAVITLGISEFVRAHTWVFALGLFTLSVLLFSQAATIAALVPLGIALGISTPHLIAMFPAVNGLFFLPIYGTTVAAIEFDQTKSTRIGSWVLNHSFMRPGVVATSSAVAIGFFLASLR